MEENREVRKVLILVLFLNLLVMGAKIILGLVSGSQSILSDGIHSLSDSFTNIVGLIGIYFSSKPKDDSHQYGHRKIEAIFGLFVGTILAYMGVMLFYEGVGSFFEPKKVAISPLGLVILVTTLAINIFVTLYEKNVGLKLNSVVLISDAKHTQSDVFISIGVLLGITLMYFGASTMVDTAVSLVVVGFIFHSAYEVLKENINLLIDKKRLSGEEVSQFVHQFDEVKAIHKVRSRGIGNTIFLDMHLLVRKDMTVVESHRLEHALRNKFRSIYGKDSELMLHIEPMMDEKKENA